MKQTVEKSRIDINENEAQCLALFEHSRDAIFFVLPAKDNQIIAANPSACFIFRTTKEELCSANLHKLVDTTDAKAASLLQECERNGISKGKLNLLRSDKSFFWAEVLFKKLPVASDQPKMMVIVHDLSQSLQNKTNLQAASHELQRLNQRLLLATKSANMGIWEWDVLKGHFTWDEGMHQIFGIDNRIQQLTFQTWLERVAKEDKQRAMQEILIALTSGQYKTEYKIQVDMGEIRYIRATGVVERDGSGNPIRLIGMNWDVTGEKIAEEKLKNSERILRNIDANSADMICSVSEDGKFIHVSAACERILGYTPQELIGNNLIDFVHPEDREKTLATAQHVMQGNSIQNFENRYVHKKGFAVPVIWAVRWDDVDRVRYGVARDASQQKKAEKAIASERQRLKDLVTNAPVSMCILKGKDHVFEMVNATYEELSGRKNIIGKTVRDVFPEVESQGFYDLLDSVFETGTPFIHNEMLVRLDVDGSGTFKDIFLNFIYQPYRNSDGEIEGIYYFGVDVTEQVESRRKIEQAEQRYRQIVETADEGIWMIDNNDKTIFVNDKLCDLLGYSREEMMGKALNELLHQDSRRAAMQGMQNMREGKAGRSQIRYLTKSGKELWANVSANPLFDNDGNYNGALAMLTDITAQRKIEEENEKLGFVASLTVNSVMITDAKGRITWVNKGFERATEYSHVEVLGKYPTEFLQGIATDPRTVRQIEDCYRKGIGFRVEVLQYSKSNKPQWMDVEGVPLRGSHGKVNGFIAIEQDITERKKSEQENLNLIDNLQKRNQDLQQFSYIVSHNLRAPIAKIMGLASIIETNDEENKFLLDKVAEEANQLDEIIKDINVIVSARKSQQEKMEFINFESKFSHVLQSFEDEMWSIGATVQADFNEAPKAFYIKSYLYSILHNLLSNAIKYRRAEEPLLVKIKTQLDGKFICLSVKDNGRGIDLQKNKSKIFGLYKRFHGDEIPGKGVGLHLVKTHAEALGGRVDIVSEINQGTEFRIYLPNNYGTEGIS